MAWTQSQRGWRRIWSGCLLSLCAAGATNAHAADTGDGTDSASPEVLARYYPSYQAWHATGVAGGVAVPTDGTQVTAGADLAAAIAGLGGPGVLVLAAGTYEITEPLTLGSGQVLIGAGADTVITYGGSEPHAAVVISEADGAGLANLTIRYPDPNGWANGDHLFPDTWANAAGATPPSDPAVSISSSQNSFLQNVRIEASPGDALAITGTDHCSLIDVVLDGVLNRGTNTGRMLISDNRALQVSGLQAIGLRRIEINGPLVESTFTDSVFGAGIEFRHAAGEITGNLFERCASILPPGYPWRPFTTWLTPLGDNNIVINFIGYHHGTDAVVPGVLVEEHQPYLIQPRRARPIFDPATVEVRPMKQVSRHQTGTPPQQFLPDPDHAPAPLASLPEGATLAPLRQRQNARRWIGQFGLPTEAWDAGISDPLAMLGEGADVNGQPLVDVSLPEPTVPEPKQLLGGQLTTERVYGRVYPLQFMRGGEFNLLEALGGWNQVGIMHQNWHIQGTCQFKVHIRDAGCLYRLFIGGAEVTDEQTIRLEAGYYPVWVMVKAKRRAPIERQSRFSIQLRQVELDTRQGRMLDTPGPGTAGFTTPRTSPVIERGLEGVQAYQALFESLREPLQPGLRDRVSEIVSAQISTAGGEAAAAVAAILARAPHDESDPEALSGEQWGELIHYYKNVGLWLRVWRINKEVPGIVEYQARYPTIQEAD